MTAAWTQYLQQTGAIFDNGSLLHFGNPDTEQQSLLNSDVLMDISQLGLIKVTGSDAEKFLQGQMTNDVRQVTAEHSQLTACCSPKGRVIVNFRLFKWQEAYYLLLPNASLEMLLKRLRMYVLRSDVQLSNMSDELARMALVGSNSSRLLAEQLGVNPPAAVNACYATDDYCIIHHSGVQPRYLLIGNSEALIAAWEKLVAHCQSIGSNAWTFFDILAGIPQITPAVAEEFIPQMLNYQHLEGVSFKKGCYTGQEIIARMQYLGALKRRMYLAQVSGGQVPAAGDALYVAGNKQSIGKIVNTHPHPDGGHLLLAVLQMEDADQYTVYLNEPQGVALELLELPYTVETAAA